MSNLDTKAILKYLKLNESNISMVLGALVIAILGIIVINYFRNQNTPEIQTGTSTEVQETEQPTLKSGQGPVQYTVSKGESLWTIALKQYGTGYNWVDIAQASNIKNPNAIDAGQKITIPDVQPKGATVITDDNGAASTEVITSSTYTVVKGDSLWKIAVKVYGNGNAWTKISTANKLANPNIIHSGNLLSIPK